MMGLERFLYDYSLLGTMIDDDDDDDGDRESDSMHGNKARAGPAAYYTHPLRIWMVGYGYGYGFWMDGVGDWMDMLGLLADESW